MFKFLKEKLKSAISRISEGVEKSAQIQDLRDAENAEHFQAEGKIGEKIIEKSEEPPREEKGFFARIKEKIVGGEETKAQPSAGRPKETLPKPGPIFIKPAELKAAEKASKKIEAAKPKEIREDAPAPNAKIFRKPKEPEKREIKEGLFEKIRPKAEEKETEPEKKGLFASIKEKIITKKIDESQFEKLFWDLEMALMENNVAMEVIEKIKNDLKGQLVEKPIKRTKVEDTIVLALKNSIEGLFESNSLDLLYEIRNKKEKPYIIAFFGINGSGKTTSIAKIAKMVKDSKISCILAASDTFRAASIEQLQQHADNIGVRMIKHDYGADPAAVAFDAIKHAKAKNIDVVLIDTAGRMHSNTNLVQEMQKIVRVTKPDLKIFVGESITGNDCVEQAKTFNDAIGIDGIILAKADIDEKGGAAVSISYVTKKPILYLGIGQNYGDLQRFDSDAVIKSLGLA
jgi:fused signal recognition particle receptor